jgi:CMP-N-acetylneuraminic acid synthetase/SAM-dependent methyltransferase
MKIIGKNVKVLAILPLRSGSKRIRDKNIRNVGYKPLFAHSINTCLDIDAVKKIIVSVDCIEYKKMVEMYFSNNRKVSVIIRPEEMASDYSKTEDTMLHSIEHVEQEGESYDYALLVQATNPLTRSEDILNGINLLKENSSINSVFSACESKKFYLDDIDTLIKRPMTQEKIPKIHEVGCFWCVRIDQFKQKKNRIIEPYDFIIVSEYDALDIDTEDDMLVVDYLLSRRIREKEEMYYKKRPATNATLANDDYYGDKVDPDGNIRNILLEKQSRIDFAKDEVEYINTLVGQDVKANSLKFLSIGCGAGYAEGTVLGAYTKYGVEPDLDAYKIAKKVFDFAKHGVFEVKNYKHNFFDVILCHHVIEHVEHPISFVQDIWSILKQGGKLVIGTPNFDGAMARRYESRFRLLRDTTHISLFSDFSLKELLEDNRYKVNYIDYPYFNTKYFNNKDLKRLLTDDGISPPFYGNIFTIYAEKK